MRIVLEKAKRTFGEFRFLLPLKLGDKLSNMITKLINYLKTSKQTRPQKSDQSIKLPIPNYWLILIALLLGVVVVVVVILKMNICAWKRFVSNQNQAWKHHNIRIRSVFFFLREINVRFSLLIQ